jgi:hypothetical protein
MYKLPAQKNYWKKELKKRKLRVYLNTWFLKFSLIIIFKEMELYLISFRAPDKYKIGFDVDESPY